MFSLSDKLLSNILELLFWIVHLQPFPGAYEIRSRLSIPYRTSPIHPYPLLQFHLLFIPPASLTPGVYSSHIKYFAIPQHNISHPTNACHAVSFILNSLPSHSYPSSLIARLQLILYTVAPVSPTTPPVKPPDCSIREDSLPPVILNNLIKDSCWTVSLPLVHPDHRLLNLFREEVLGLPCPGSSIA